MKTEILSTHTPELFAAAVKRAAELLRAGEVVALPTETVYGLAANALDEKAVAKIFQIKGRPANNPIIVHVAGIEMAKRCVTELPAAGGQTGKSILARPADAGVAARGKNSRQRDGGRRNRRHPLAEPSVHSGGDSRMRFSAGRAEREFVRAAFRRRTRSTSAHSSAAKIPLIVDGGQSQVGIESTVLDLTVSPPRILRPGMIHAESLAAVGGERSTVQQSNVQHPTLRSPGLLQKHYSPKAKLVVMNWRDDADLCRQLSTLNPQLSTVHVIAHTRIPSGEKLGGVSVIPHDAEAFARALYAELHRCDEAGAQAIVVEAPPDSPEWAGIADRLRRAAA